MSLAKAILVLGQLFRVDTGQRAPSGPDTGVGECQLKASEAPDGCFSSVGFVKEDSLQSLESFVRHLQITLPCFQARWRTEP